jgi:molybdopterin synthase catalytic subunit
LEALIQITTEPIERSQLDVPPDLPEMGSWVEFFGVVRGMEDGRPIQALEYQAYQEMAIREMRSILERLDAKNPCLRARIIHRIGVIPVGDNAIYAGIASAHRGEGFTVLASFMDCLKRDVPIWKVRSIPR